MKTEEEINNARAKIIERVKTPGLNDVQKSLLAGILNALVWCADGQDSSTMERLLSDEPAPGKIPGPALKRFDKFRLDKGGF